MLGKGKRQIYIKHKMSSCFKNMPFKKVNPQHNLWTTTTMLLQQYPEDSV